MHLCHLLVVSMRRHVDASTCRRVDASTPRRVDASTRRRIDASTRRRFDALIAFQLRRRWTRPFRSLARTARTRRWIYSAPHGGRRSIRSVARSIDRVDRFDRFGMIFDFLETSGSSRSVRCQSFSSVRRLEVEKTPKKQNEKNWIFGQVRFGRFDNPFDSIDNVPMGDGGPS